jgi:tRNA1(Val) A37 N6-methylase TrmN6
VNGGFGDSISRVEQTCTFTELCAAASRALRQGGRFALVHRPERLDEVLEYTRAAGLQPKRLRFVQQDAESAPNLFLLETRRGGRAGLTVEKPLLLKENGRDSREFRRIYHLDLDGGD